MAVDAKDRPGTGGMALAGPRGGHAGDGQCGQCLGSWPPSREYRRAGPQAASEAAGGGEALAHTPVAVGVARGSGMPKHCSAL